MAISFPNTSISALSANVGALVSDQRVLLIGQKLNAGTAPLNTLIPITTPGTENVLFGAKSHLAYMARNFSKVYSFPRLYAIALDEPTSGTACSITVELSAAILSAFRLKFWLTDVDVVYEMSYPGGTSVTPAQFATDMAATINNNAGTPHMPFSAAASGNVCTITYAHTGVVGNQMGIQFDISQANGATVLPGGATLAVAKTAGTGQPQDLSTIADIIGTGLRFQTIVTNFDYSFTPIVDLLEERFDETEKSISGQLIVTRSGTYSTLASQRPADDYNKKTLTIFASPDIDLDLNKGTIYGKMNDAVSAFIAAARTKRYTDGEDISTLVTSPGPLDSIGGLPIRTLPYANTPMQYLQPARPEWEFTGAMNKDLVAAGYGVFGNNPANTGVVLGEVRTTYGTNGVGAEDVTFAYLNYVDTITASIEALRNYISVRFPQTRLQVNTPGYSGITKATFEQEMGLFYQFLADNLLVIDRTVDGGAAQDRFVSRLASTLTINPATGTIIGAITLPIVTELRALILSVTPSFTTA